MSRHQFQSFRYVAVSRVAVLSLLLAVGVVHHGQTAGSISAMMCRDALEMALSAHTDVAQAQYALSKAELELAAARAEVIFPTVQLGVSPFTLAQGAEFPGTTHGSISLNLGLATGTSVSLDLGPSYRWASDELTISWRFSLSQRYDPGRPISLERRTVTEAEDKLISAQRALEQAREGVVFAVLQSYASLLSSKTAVQDTERSLIRAQDVLAVIEADVEAGQARELQRLEAEIALQEAEIAVRKRTASYTTALNDFMYMIGLALPGELAPTGNISAQLPGAVDELLSREIPAEALAGSGTVRSATDALNTAEERLRALQVAGWPVSSLGVSWADTGWRVSLNLSVALFAPDRNVKRQIAQGEVDLARDRLALAWREAERAIIQTRSALQDAREALMIQEMERSKLALERVAAEIRLEAGLIGPADWETFLLREERFESEYEQRLFGLLQAYLRYRRVLGLDLNWEAMIP